jgi:hypothetical protein
VARAQREYPFKKIKWLMMTLLRIGKVNIRTETTFLDFYSFQPQLNGDVDNGQDQYLMWYVS